MGIKDITQNNLSAFLEASIENFLAYDNSDLGVTPGQILDFQCYVDTFEERGHAIDDNFDQLDALYIEMLRKIALRSFISDSNPARTFLGKQMELECKYKVKGL